LRHVIRLLTAFNVDLYRVQILEKNQTPSLWSCFNHINNKTSHRTTTTHPEAWDGLVTETHYSLKPHLRLTELDFFMQCPSSR